MVTRVTLVNRKMNCQQSFALKVLLTIGFIAMSTLATPTTITAPPVVSENLVSHDKDDLKHIFGHCLHKKDVMKCLKHRVIEVVDDVIQSDDSMSLNLFNMKMSLKKNPQFKDAHDVMDTGRSFEDVMSQKLKNLLESRVIQVKLAEDEAENSDAQSELNEARKKKGGGGGKHGTMMMSGKQNRRHPFSLSFFELNAFSFRNGADGVFCSNVFIKSRFHVRCCFTSR